MFSWVCHPAVVTKAIFISNTLYAHLYAWALWVTLYSPSASSTQLIHSVEFLHGWNHMPEKSLMLETHTKLWLNAFQASLDSFISICACWILDTIVFIISTSTVTKLCNMPHVFRSYAALWLMLPNIQWACCQASWWKEFIFWVLILTLRPLISSLRRQQSFVDNGSGGTSFRSSAGCGKQRWRGIACPHREMSRRCSAYCFTWAGNQLIAADVTVMDLG